MRQLGKALSIVATQRAELEMMFMDLHAFHAPSECGALILRGEDRRKREAMRRARSFSGLNRRQFRLEVGKNHRHIERVMCDIINRKMPGF